jgi:hypothetical protein
MADCAPQAACARVNRDKASAFPNIVRVASMGGDTVPPHTVRRRAARAYRDALFCGDAADQFVHGRCGPAPQPAKLVRRHAQHRQHIGHHMLRLVGDLRSESTPQNSRSSILGSGKRIVGIEYAGALYEVAIRNVAAYQYE